MNRGEGLVAILYAIRDLVETSMLWVMTSFGVLYFFWIIILFISQKMGWGGSGSLGVLSSGAKKIDSTRIFQGLLILFIMFSLYSLMALTAKIFGVNGGVSGGLQVTR